MLLNKETRVLILYNRLFHYRIPIFEELSKQCDLTVACCLDTEKPTDVTFKIKKLNIRKYWKFTINRENVVKYCKEFDVVVAYGDIQWLSYSTLVFIPFRKFKLLFWGIGVSASYDKKFDVDQRFDKLKDFFHKKADAQIYYSNYPIAKKVKAGYREESLFVANNTVKVEDVALNEERNRLLFLGTLYKAKGIMYLLEAYEKAIQTCPNIPSLDIIGGGSEYDNIKKWIDSRKLENRIILHGAIYDNNIKAKFFSKSLATISPTQAGLSVLESMGYGTPFITTKDAITGGEIFNIKNNVNGVLLDNLEQLEEALIDIANNKDKYLMMGRNAYSHYHLCRKQSDMAGEIAAAIEYTLTL